MTVLLLNEASEREFAHYASSATAPYQYVVVSGTASRGPVTWPRVETPVQTRMARSDWQEWLAFSRHRRIRELAERFAGRVSAIAEVKAVTFDWSEDEPRIVTYIEKRDLAVRHRVYEAEDEVCAGLAGLQLDFQVVSLDAPGAVVPPATAAGPVLLLMCR